MDKEFYRGKKILVTGATGDLGKALVKSLAQAGAYLIITSRSERKLRELSTSLPTELEIITLTADLSIPGEAEKLAKEALKSAGHIDVLFNNAGLGYFALMEEADEEKIRHLFVASHQEFVSPPRTSGQVKPGVGHGFGAARENHFGVAGTYERRGLHQAHHAGRTDHVDRHAVHIVGNPRLQRRLPGDKLSLPCAQHIAHDIEVQVPAGHRRGLERALHGVRRQVYR